MAFTTANMRFYNGPIVLSAMGSNLNFRLANKKRAMDFPL
jgi:hypothetical protein